MKRPENYDNSWLGCTGITIALCCDKNGKIICKTLDAPNPVAYAVQTLPTISKVIGLLGEYDMKEMRKRYVDPNSKVKFQHYIDTL